VIQNTPLMNQSAFEATPFFYDPDLFQDFPDMIKPIDH